MHGELMLQELETLARDFDRIAVPPHGRYVRQPALADERGVLMVPPPMADPLPLMLAVGAAFVGAVLLRGRLESRT